MTGAICTPFISPISAVVQGVSTTVYFSDPHPYCLGEILSFRMSEAWGMVQLNEKQGTVIEVGANFVKVDIDSTDFSQFTIPVLIENITNILVDTPAPGSTRIEFDSNLYLDGSNIIIYNVLGTLSDIINGFIFTVYNSNPTFLDISLTSTGYVYGGGGVTTAYPLTIADVPPFAIPSGSGVIPDSNPSTVALQCAFDRVRI